MEVDVELLEEFNKAYPSRGAKRVLTIAAIKQALRLRPLMEVEHERLRSERGGPEGSSSESTGMQEDVEKRDSSG